MDQPVKREGWEAQLLGLEEYVLITSRGETKVPEIYLNHDEEDLMSFRYWESLGTPKEKLQRRYLDEIYSVIDGVADGAGLSVLPRHLIKQDKRIRILQPTKYLASPVYMLTKKSSYRPKHIQAAMDKIAHNLQKNLLPSVK